jgi:hypothetical protein
MDSKNSFAKTVKSFELKKDSILDIYTPETEKYGSSIGFSDFREVCEDLEKKGTSLYYQDKDHTTYGPFIKPNIKNEQIDDIIFMNDDEYAENTNNIIQTEEMCDDVFKISNYDTLTNLSYVTSDKNDIIELTPIHEILGKKEVNNANKNSSSETSEELSKKSICYSFARDMVEAMTEIPPNEIHPKSIEEQIDELKKRRQEIQKIVEKSDESSMQILNSSSFDPKEPRYHYKKTNSKYIKITTCFDDESNTSEERKKKLLKKGATKNMIPVKSKNVFWNNKKTLEDIKNMNFFDHSTLNNTLPLYCNKESEKELSFIDLITFDKFLVYINDFRDSLIVKDEQTPMNGYHFKNIDISEENKETIEETVLDDGEKEIDLLVPENPKPTLTNILKENRRNKKRKSKQIDNEEANIANIVTKTKKVRNGCLFDVIMKHISLYYSLFVNQKKKKDKIQKMKVTRKILKSFARIFFLTKDLYNFTNLELIYLVKKKMKITRLGELRSRICRHHEEHDEREEPKTSKKKKKLYDFSSSSSTENMNQFPCKKDKGNIDSCTRCKESLKNCDLLCFLCYVVIQNDILNQKILLEELRRLEQVDEKRCLINESLFAAGPPMNGKPHNLIGNYETRIILSVLLRNNNFLKNAIKLHDSKKEENKIKSACSGCLCLKEKKILSFAIYSILYFKKKKH